MASSVKKNKCKSKTCNSQKKSSNQNGKGDNPRPFSKKNYNNNYESINWKTQ